MQLQDFYLLKFISSASKIEGRKRLQKLIYLMKYIGFPIEARFSMHYYGPYSADLAVQIDHLVNRNLIKEDSSIGYSYELTQEGKKILNEVEKNPSNREYVNFISPWTTRFNSFYKERVPDLEIASTILFWIEWGKSNKDAVRTTVNQKGRPNSSAIRIANRAIELKKALSSQN
ncbi:MAG: hypothetical protein LUQ65_01645 [Candidatus Helarchaeota archaeon]|nr:hypothetical protein [Candidatus Helarchaeota archaeon]